MKGSDAHMKLATKVEFLLALLTNLGFHCDLERDREPYGVSPRALSAFHRFRRTFGLVGEGEAPDETVPPFVKLPLVAEADLRKRYAPAFEKLLRLHSQVATPTRRFLAKEKLGRLRSPVHRLFLGPLWNRINALEGPALIVDAHMHGSATSSSRRSPGAGTSR